MVASPGTATPPRQSASARDSSVGLAAAGSSVPPPPPRSGDTTGRPCNGGARSERTLAVDLDSERITVGSPQRPAEFFRLHRQHAAACQGVEGFSVAVAPLTSKHWQSRGPTASQLKAKTVRSVQGVAPDGINASGIVRSVTPLRNRARVGPERQSRVVRAARRRCRRGRCAAPSRAPGRARSCDVEVGRIRRRSRSRCARRRQHRHALGQAHADLSQPSTRNSSRLTPWSGQAG